MNPKKIIAAIFSTMIFSTVSFAQTEINNKKQPVTYSAEKLNYSTSGSAEVVIQRPINEVFNILTNVNQWPQINKGVTKAIEPKNIKANKGAIFKESISSPIPGIKDWTNEWHIVEFEKNKKFVIAGIEQFAQVPIHSKITYEFDHLGHNKTKFERTIEVTLDDHFIKNANKSEVEALYRFLGSQWEMASHLKHYIESQPLKK